MKYVILFLLLTQMITAQALYQGPAQGSVTGGIVVNTNNFLKSETTLPRERIGRNKVAPKFGEEPLSNEPSPFNAADIYMDDIVSGKSILDTAAPVLINSFQGIQQTNSIPPDPHVAVGPQHVLATVNADFAIYDKSGNRLVRIQGASWFRDLFPSVSPFDPKVIYDHYAKRWVMVWLDQDDNAKLGYFFISVSDDSIPLGTWYNYMLPSNVNGNTFDSTWSDYQGVGFDSVALYVTGDQFRFRGSFAYTKIRIIPKTQLYANTAGPLSYFDLWSIRNPANLNSSVFNIRPSISFNSGSTYYLLHSPYNSANWVILYKITNPTTNPVMTANRITVSSFSSPPTPRQLGNNSIPLESSSTGLNNEPVFRDGKLWVVHTVRNPQASGFSAIHYMGIDVQSNTSAAEGFFGAQGYFYLYPSIMVDKHNNLAVTFSRCGDAEYIGAYFAGRKQTDPPGLTGSYAIQTGKSDYVLDYGSGRNRWGDYMGIWLDPVNQEDFYMLTEFVPGKNRWGTWVGVTRMAPYQGASPFLISKTIDFGNIEYGVQSDVVPVRIANFGNQPFTITGLSYRNDVFIPELPFQFPKIVSPYDTVSFNFRFKPTAKAKISDTLKILSGTAVIASAVLKANGYVLSPALNRKVYAVSAGKIISLNKQTAAGTLIGESGFPTIVDLATHPVHRTIYGLVNLSSSSALVRVNGLEGDAYQLAAFPTIAFNSMAFDTAGRLHLATTTGLIYRYNFTNGQLTRVDSSKAPVAYFTFHPKTNECWASVYRPVGDFRDKIFKVRIPSGDTSLVGSTNLGFMNTGLFFDESGKLFGVQSSSAISDVYSIDTITGAGTIIGGAGFGGVCGMEYNPADPSVAASEFPSPQSSFLLVKSYPNPFNPATTLNITLARNAKVRMEIFTLLGESVETVFNGDLPRGEHKITWNPSGSGIQSGVYFCVVSAEYGTERLQVINKLAFVK